MPALQKKIIGKQIQGTVQQLQEWGEGVAKSLLKELKPPSQTYSMTYTARIAKGIATDSYDQLMNQVPNRGNGPDDVSFYSYQENKETRFPTREMVFSKMSEDGFVAFCCASLEAQVVQAFESDHVFAFARIKERQEALLECLNEHGNKIFADAFLKTPEIEKYFRRDSADNRIKGTKRFFYDCFNDVSNLLPITHHINREKSDRSTKEWVEKVFPKKLIEEMESKGGIQEGIIIDRVLNKEGMPEFPIGEVTTTYSTKESKTENIQVHVHKGYCGGLGDFVAGWFNKNPSVKEDAGKAYELKQKLTSMIKEGLDSGNKKEIVFRKIFRKISVSTQAMEQIYDRMGVSSDDSSDANETKGAITIDDVLRGITYMHKAKQAKQIAKRLFHDAIEFDEFKKNFYQMGINAGILRLPTPKDIDKAMDIVLSELEKRMSITTKEMLEIFETAEAEVNPLKQQLKKEKERADAEAAARKIAENESAMLRARLAAFQTTQAQQQASYSTEEPRQSIGPDGRPSNHHNDSPSLDDAIARNAGERRGTSRPRDNESDAEEKPRESKNRRLE